jgi:hypothetical protein
MKKNKLLIGLFVLAGVLSFLLYRAVVNVPLPRQGHPIKEDVKPKHIPAQQEMVTEKKANVEIKKETGSKVEVKGDSGQKGVFEGHKELSPEEKRRIFEEEMRANIPPDKSIEEIFRSSMNMGRLEGMSEEQREEVFLRSMGGGLSDEERRAYFEESMGIRKKE